MGNSVSVVVPSYNYAHYLRACVTSVLDQPGVDVRVLVIDDCSSDDTPEVGEKLALDPRVTYRRHTVNAGHIATYNEGLLEWADSDYCMLLSADDLLTPGALHRAVTVMEADPEVGFVYGNPLRFSSGKPLPEARAGVRSKVWSGERWIRGVCRAGRNLIIAPETVVRTSLQHEVGGYNPLLPHSADLELWLRLAARGSVGWLPDADQAFYRIHDSNMHHSTFNARQRLAQLRGAYESFFDTDGGLLTAGPRLRQEMRRALARAVLRSAIRALDSGEAEVHGSPVGEVVEAAWELTDLRWLPEYPAVRARLAAGPRRCRRAAPVVRAVTYPRTWARWHWNRLHPV